MIVPKGRLHFSGRTLATLASFSFTFNFEERVFKRPFFNMDSITSQRNREKFCENGFLLTNYQLTKKMSFGDVIKNVNVKLVCISNNIILIAKL